MTVLRSVAAQPVARGSEEATLEPAESAAVAAIVEADGLRNDCSGELDWEKAHDLYAEAAETSDLGRLVVAILAVRGEAGFQPGKGVEESARSAMAGAERLARQGVVPAMRAVGVALASGLGGPRDRAAAEPWLSRAAERGDHEAAVWLAFLEITTGIDTELAVGRLERAADAGSCIALSELGHRLVGGLGITADVDRGMTLMKRAARAGYLSAAVRLAEVHLEGEAVEPDPELAKTWLLRAAEAGFARAQLRLGWEYAQGRTWERDGELAVKWLEEAGRSGSALALNNLGWFHHQGIAVERDLDAAISYYLRAAEMGDDRARANLANLVEDESLTDAQRGRVRAGIEALGSSASEQDRKIAALLLWSDASGRNEYEEALVWARDAATVGDAEALEMLGRAYDEGRGVDRDLDRALEYYERAARAGSLPAAYQLGRLLLGWEWSRGQRLEGDPDRARYWLELAGIGGHLGAANLLGWLLDGGYYDVERDPEAALRWYRAAAAAGDVEAIGIVRYAERRGGLQ